MPSGMRLCASTHDASDATACTRATCIAAAGLAIAAPATAVDSAAVDIASGCTVGAGGTGVSGTGVAGGSRVFVGRRVRVVVMSRDFDNDGDCERLRDTVNGYVAVAWCVRDGVAPESLLERVGAGVTVGDMVNEADAVPLRDGDEELLADNVAVCDPVGPVRDTVGLRL